MRVVVVAAVFLAVSSRSVAQGVAQSDSKDDDKFPMSVEWGFGPGRDGIAIWDEMTPAFRFAPVRVAIGPIDASMKGEVVISHAQDTTQSVWHEVPFSTTPGEVTFVETCVALPAGLDQATVTAIGPGGRRLASRSFGFFGEDSLELPQIDAGGAPRFVTLGTRPLSSRDTRAVIGFRDRERSRWERSDPLSERDAWLASVGHDATPIRDGALAGLPLSWAAYEGVSAVVARAGDLVVLESAQRSALSRWIGAGGVLVLVADAPGEDWRLAPTPEPLAGFVGFGPVSRVSLPDALGGAAISGRELGLNGGGRDRGWRVSMGGLLAQGPVGLGRVLVLGVDPGSIAAPEDATDEDRDRARRERDDVWASILTPIAMESEDARLGQWGDDGGAFGGFRFRGSVRSGENTESDAIADSIDSVLRAEPVGAGAFVFIAIGFAVLGVVVSIIDPILLKRKKLRHRAWLTGLAWTGLFGLGMAVVPGLLRDGAAEYGRRGLTDVVQARPDPITGTARPPIAAARTGVTTILTGSGSEVLLGAQPPGHWIRGVGPSGYGYSYYDRQQMLPALSLVRGGIPSPSAGLVPTSLLGVRGGDLQDRDASVRQGVWTLRCMVGLDPMLDQRAGAIPSVELVAGEPPSLRVANLPDGWRARFGVHAAGMAFLASEPGSDSGSLDASTLAAGVPLRLTDESFEGRLRHWMDDRDVPSFFGSPAELPLAREREASIDAYIRDSSSWAVVYLLLRHEESIEPAAPWDWFDPRSPGASDGRVTREEYFRIAVPLTAEARASFDRLAAKGPISQPATGDAP